MRMCQIRTDNHQWESKMDSYVRREPLETAIHECERFYPAFQFVVWGGRSPTDAVAMAMIDTVGEA